MHFGSARWVTGSFGRRGGRGRYGRYGQYGTDGNVPQFRPDSSPRTSLSHMAEVNGWAQLGGLPTYEDGTALDLSGGPFAPRQWNVVPPVVEGRAGHWAFWASTVTAMTRGASVRPYALTIMQIGGVVPYVHVYPEAWRASITSVTPEVHLESGLFNDRFATFADDPQTVYGLLNPRAMQLLLDSPPVDEIWTADQFVCIARVDPHHAEALGAHLNLLTSIVGGIPSSLYERG